MFMEHILWVNSSCYTGWETESSPEGAFSGWGEAFHAFQIGSLSFKYTASKAFNIEIFSSGIMGLGAQKEDAQLPGVLLTAADLDPRAARGLQEQLLCDLSLPSRVPQGVT